MSGFSVLLRVSLVPSMGLNLRICVGCFQGLFSFTRLKIVLQMP